jgi:hypothetical protein
MQRVVVVLVVAVCVCLAPGCGSALQAKARKVVGDPRATVVSTQKVRALNGAHLTVVVMKPGGSQGLGCLIAQSYVSGSTRAYRCPHSQDAYVLLGTTSHADMGEVGISRFQVAAIARAQATSPRFGVFPSVNQFTVRCTIPNPDLGAHKDTLPDAMCATVALPYGGHVRCVAFIEAWRPSAASKLHTRGWIVPFARDGDVRPTRLTPHPTPPWNGHQPNTCSEISRPGP